MQLNDLQRSWASARADALLDISADSGPDDCEILGYWYMFGLNYPGDEWMKNVGGEYGHDYTAHRTADGWVHDFGRESCKDCMPSMHIGPDGAEHEGKSRDCAACIAMVDDGFYPPGDDEMPAKENVDTDVDWVNPPHYKRGPLVKFKIGQFESERVVECIEVVRHVPDFRLANAIRYIWRVAFGGKWDDNEDIRKAVWYLVDWLGNPVSREE